MFPSEIPTSIVASLLRPHGVTIAEPVTPGMSGSRIYRCRCGSGERVALKRWVNASATPRVELCHRLQRIARAGGNTLVPRPWAMAADGQSVWELLDWMPGTALGRNASLPQIAAGAAAIGEFHHHVHGAAARIEIPFAVTSRLDRLQQLSRLLPTMLLRTDPPLDSAVLTKTVEQARRLLSANWNEAASRIIRSLTPWTLEPSATQYVLRDVHREHILYTSETPRALIDFDAVRIDTPATDLARWTASFFAGSAGRLRSIGGPRDRGPLWDAAMAGYASKCPSFNHDGMSRLAALASCLAFANTWISLANWLVWICQERRVFPAGSNAVATRLSEFVQVATVDVASWGDLGGNLGGSVNVD